LSAIVVNCREQRSCLGENLRRRVLLHMALAPLDVAGGCQERNTDAVNTGKRSSDIRIREDCFSVYPARRAGVSTRPTFRFALSLLIGG